MMGSVRGTRDSRLLRVRRSSQGGGDRGSLDADDRDVGWVSRAGSSHHEAALARDVDDED